MISLIFIGIFVGFLSGFFGIGGGTILVPLLLLFGFQIKTAVGVSIVQMVFSSLYGSYLNFKKGTLNLAMVSFIGFGGFFGAFFSGYIGRFISDKTIEVIFFIFIFFAISRLFFHVPNQIEQKQVSKVILLVIGMCIGLLSMLIGVGGSVILVPILVGFLAVPLKQATSAGLFFVVFSSISGLISHSINMQIDFYSGIFIGLSSLIGVYGGVLFKHKVSNKSTKILLLCFYFCIISYLGSRMLWGI